MSGRRNTAGRPACMILAVLLSGCATAAMESGSAPPDFGQAISHNMALQIVNPEAPASNEPLTMEGRRAAVGQGRYVTDSVEPPRDMRTSVQGGGG